MTTVTTTPPTTAAPSGATASTRLALVSLLTVGAGLVLWHAGDAPAATMRALTLAEPAPLVAGCLRLLGFTIAMWLVTVTGAAVLLRLAGAHRASRAVARLLPAVMRRLVHASMGLTMVGTVLAGPAGAAIARPATTQATARYVAGDTTNGQRWPLITRPAPATTTLATARPTSVPGVGTVSVPTGATASLPNDRRPPGGRASSTTVPAPAVPSRPRTVPPAVATGPLAVVASAPAGPAGPSVPAGPARPVGPSGHSTMGQWTVAPGDHFWSIADRVVTARHPDATEQEIARYWLALIDTNLSRLDDPSNPDLLRVGLVLDVPAPQHDA